MKTMKEDYVKPEIEILMFVGEVLMAAGSLGEGEDDQESAANEHRGVWGNLWD